MERQLDESKNMTGEKYGSGSTQFPDVIGYQNALHRTQVLFAQNLIVTRRNKL